MWFASENEEMWSCQPQFATRKEAEEWGRAEFDGDFWVGEGELVQPEDFGRWAAKELVWKFGDGSFEEDEELGAEDAVLSEPNAEQEADLRTVLSEWCRRHKLLSAWWKLEFTTLVEVGD